MAGGVLFVPGFAGQTSRLLNRTADRTRCKNRCVRKAAAGVDTLQNHLFVSAGMNEGKTVTVFGNAVMNFVRATKQYLSQG